jgi:hypothetical protein
VSPQAVLKNWIDRGELPAMHVGRRVRVRWGDVEAMMVPAGPATPGGGRPSEPSADAQAFWEGRYVPLAGLPGSGDS